MEKCETVNPHSFIPKFCKKCGFLNSQTGSKDIDETYFNHAISKAVRRYIKNYVESHAFPQLFGSQKSSSLASIYIPQRFQAHVSIRNFDSVDELEEAFTRDRQRSTNSKGSNLIGMNLANEEEYLIILGQPATGKTTFLKYIGLETLRYPECRYGHDVFPVFLQMQKFCRITDTLLEAIVKELEKSRFPEPQKLALWMMEQGKLLILIDGINESTLPQKYLLDHIRDFVKSYPQNRYIASSRLASYQNSLGQFLEVVLQPWSDLHIQEYIHKWFAIVYESKNSQLDTSNHQFSSSEKDIASEEAQRCWQILQLNSIAREIAKSPLSLSLLCLLYDRHHSFPSNVSRLYEKAIHLLLEEQVLKYQLHHHEGENNLSTDILDILLTEIAYKGSELRQSRLSLTQVTEYIQTVLTSCTNGSPIQE